MERLKKGKSKTLGLKKLGKTTIIFVQFHNATSERQNLQKQLILKNTRKRKKGKDIELILIMEFVFVHYAIRCLIKGISLYLMNLKLHFPQRFLILPAIG